MKLFSENFFPKSNALIKRLKFFQQNLKVAAVCAENGKFYFYFDFREKKATFCDADNGSLLKTILSIVLNIWKDNKTQFKMLSYKLVEYYQSNIIF